LCAGAKGWLEHRLARDSLATRIAWHLLLFAE